jgi:DNA-directed RNA polymerase subunit RPC12/RpoP
MAYKCLDCGKVFEDYAKWEENVGEFWGTAAYETVYGCPHCKGEFEETIPCDICGEEHLKDELFGGVCKNCIDKYKYDTKVCFEVGKHASDTVELNLFLATLFTKEEIEEILFKALQEEEKINKTVNCQKFIDLDKSWFGERLAEEVKNNENTKG